MKWFCSETMHLSTDAYARAADDAAAFGDQIAVAQPLCGKAHGPHGSHQAALFLKKSCGCCSVRPTGTTERRSCPSAVCSLPMTLTLLTGQPANASYPCPSSYRVPQHACCWLGPGCVANKPFNRVLFACDWQVLGRSTRPCLHVTGRCLVIQPGLVCM